jgi:hypothetical protein
MSDWDWEERYEKRLLKFPGFAGVRLLPDCPACGHQQAEDRKIPLCEACGASLEAAVAARRLLEQKLCREA